MTRDEEHQHYVDQFESMTFTELLNEWITMREEGPNDVNLGYTDKSYHIKFEILEDKINSIVPTKTR